MTTKSRKLFNPLQVRRTLQVNILVAFATLLIITVLVIVGYTYQQNSTAILDLSADLISQVTETVSEKTINHLAPAALMAQASARIPEADQVVLVDNRELEQYGMEVLNLYPQLAGFFIGNAQGDFLFVKRFPDGSLGTQVIDRALVPPLRTWTYRDTTGAVTEIELTENPEYDPRLRPWYEGAATSRGQYWTNIYIFFTDQKPGITAAYPIINEAEQLVGVIGIDVALDELSSFLQTQQVGQSGLAFIVNNQAEVVAYPGLSSLAMQEGEQFRPLGVSDLDNPVIETAYARHQANGRSRFTFTHNDERFIASFTALPDDFGNPWEIGIVVPEDDFVGSIKRTNEVSLIMSAIILLIAVVSALFISGSISRPIVYLTKETEKVKDFQLDGRVDIKSPIREVQTLAESISSMKNGLAAFKRYVPAELVRQLIETGEEAQLGGQEKELTIFFTDIAGFTAITEGMVPEALMLQLSTYLGELADIILKQRGTVDKYVGDGLMAFWGAPVPLADHAIHACRAALQCKQKVSQLNKQWQAAGQVAFPTRIGIHTGKTLVGNMGSSKRMNYTVLGDSVNLASRLESINDVYGTSILVSSSTYEQAAEQFHFRPLDVVTVRGKREYVLLYELMGERGQTPSELVTLCETFKEGVDAYLVQDWETALSIFETLGHQFPDDLATGIYLARCLTLRHNPPGPDWQPIVHLEKEEKKTATAAAPLPVEQI